jgi:CBS domain-containing protein
VRFVTLGIEPAFAMPDVTAPGGEALSVYVAIGAIVGVLSALTTRLVYAIEDAFEKLPVHWMWWPALGGVVVGLAGLASPRTLGVGYVNIDDIVSGRFVGGAMAAFCLWKLVSWSVALGSGTSGGTLAPLFTIGGGAGSLLGMLAADLMPMAGVDVRIAALVGMASIFAGASRALLASVVFAYETTRQPFGLLPLLGGCAAAYLVSTLMMRTSIMTEKIVRRGQPVSTEYTVDPLARAAVGEHCSHDVATVRADATVEAVLGWIESRTPDARHQGFPVLDGADRLVGVVTVRDLLVASRSATLRSLLARPLAVAFHDDTLRAAADLMVIEGVGRLPVVRREDPTRLVGILTRSDLLTAHHRRIAEARRRERVFGKPREAR